MAEPWVVPASYGQERVWLASQVAHDVPLFHIVDRIPIAGPLPAEQVIAALAEVVGRHETLRTSFRVDDGQLMQLVHASVPVEVGQADLADLPADEQDKQAAGMLDALARSELPLDRPPLWRARLVHRGEGRWWLLFLAHHTIVDAASELNLHAEVTEICAAAAGGRRARLPELPVQYADYSVWQRERLSGATLDRMLGYWREALADLPVVHALPTDRPRPVQRTFAGDELLFPLPAELTYPLPGLVTRTSASPFMVLLAAYAALLRRLTGQDDVVVGVPVSGRDRPELQPLIGMFVNMVVVRVDTGGDPTFLELVDRVRHRVLAAWEHQEMPFQKLVEALAGARDPRVPPLYQLGFNHLPVGSGTTFGAAEDDLMLEIAQREGRLEYSSDLFDATTARSIVDNYLSVLAAALGSPELRLSELPLVSQPAGAVHRPETVTAGDGFVPARTAAEELVAEIWADVLRRDRIGAYDDFFALGGHSLLALRAIARLGATGVQLPIQAFFADTTVAGVAAQVERLLAEQIAELPEDEVERQLADGAPEDL
ncbi:MAG: condensation domain-containing protein [Mycobacteriales bacterium]